MVRVCQSIESVCITQLLLYFKIKLNILNNFCSQPTLETLGELAVVFAGESRARNRNSRRTWKGAFDSQECIRLC